MICGRKTITDPTPPITPSESRSRSAPSGSNAFTASPIQPTSASIHSCG